MKKPKFVNEKIVCKKLPAFLGFPKHLNTREEKSEFLDDIYTRVEEELILKKAEEIKRSREK